ncbi:MAG: hypothetical protein R8G66_28230 [Cytophagales bacterium]|nr:hypothetical protein [Cytophagales bacterium]
MKNSCFILLLTVWVCACSKKTEEKPNYLHQRSELIKENESLRFDADIVLNAQEKALDEKLVTLRKEMTADYLKTSFFPPSEPFFKSKEHIEETTLFQLFRKMPKGGIQHLHSSAGIDFRWLINRAQQEPDCYIYWGPKHPNHIKGQLHFYKETAVKEGFLPASEVLAKASNRQELLELLILDQETVSDSTDIWAEFENVFNRINGFFHYQPLFKDYLRSAVDTLLADGVQHTEIRMIFFGGLYDLEHSKGSGFYDADAMASLLQELIDEVKAVHPEFSMKFIYTHLRFMKKEDVFKELVNAYELRKKYPDLIRGFDLVANEDDGNSTLHFLENWEKMDSLEQVYGVDMPLYLHDGESDWASVQNLYDAYLLRSKRIGHGFNLMHFPALINDIKSADICIEVSPLSNQILGYIDDLRLHPASYMLKNGVQISINSDDPGIFNYNGLSYDYWTIFLAWEMDLKALKKLSMNALTYSALSEEEKKVAFTHWQKQWDTFIEEGNRILD